MAIERGKSGSISSRKSGKTDRRKSPNREERSEEKSGKAPDESRSERGPEKPRYTGNKEPFSKFSKQKYFKKEKEESAEKPKFKRKDSAFSKKKTDKPFDSKNIKPEGTSRPETREVTDETRLNKYIASSGICSRREADKLIAQGMVTVNGEVITQMGVKIKPTDVVTYGGEKLKFQKFVYLLMNKPKNIITTSDDPQGRQTVMDILANTVKERIYPVGRLDRMTTGLLLLTNDGDLAKKLAHPKFKVQKVYHVTLTKPVTKTDMIKLTKGVKLEDGLAMADAASYVGDGTLKNEIGISLHSGKNRVIRRMMEELGYVVSKLDRVSFGGLTKKTVPRGKWRELTEREVGMLKMIG